MVIIKLFMIAVSPLNDVEDNKAAIMKLKHNTIRSKTVNVLTKTRPNVKNYFG